MTDLDRLAEEYNRASDYAEARPFDDEAWVRLHEAHRAWQRADREARK